MNKFWTVWNPRGASPTVRHVTYIAATEEAKRLAALNKTSEFYVMEFQGVATAVDVKYIEAS